MYSKGCCFDLLFFFLKKKVRLEKCNCPKKEIRYYFETWFKKKNLIYKFFFSHFTKIKMTTMSIFRLMKNKFNDQKSGMEYGNELMFKLNTFLYI